MRNIGDLIRERRQALGITQDELAQKVGYKSGSSITRLENERDIPIQKLKPIADALDIDVRVLVGWDKENSTDLLIESYYRLSDDNKRALMRFMDYLVQLQEGNKNESNKTK